MRFDAGYIERATFDLLWALSFADISGRPQRRRQDPQMLEGFKRTFAARLRRT